MRALPSWPRLLPMVPLWNTITLGIRFQHMNWWRAGDACIQSIALDHTGYSEGLSRLMLVYMHTKKQKTKLWDLWGCQSLNPRSRGICFLLCLVELLRGERRWQGCCVLSGECSHSVTSDSLPMDSNPLGTCPRNSPGKNTGVGCHALLQGIILTQGLNPGLLHGR